MESNIDNAVAILFGLFYLWFTYVTRKTKSFGDFSVGKGAVSPVLIFASISATFVGPGFTMGLTRKGSETGFLFFFIVLAYVFQLILVGTFIAPKIREKFGGIAFSIGDVTGGVRSHNNRLTQVLTGIIAFCLCIGFISVLNNSMGDLGNYYFNIPKPSFIILMATIISLYSFFGGIKSSIYADALQFLIFVIIIPALLFLLLLGSGVSASELTGKAVELTERGYGELGALALVGLVASFFFGEFLLPPLINRALASKDPNSSRKSFLSSAVFLAFWLFVMISIGMVGSMILKGPSDDTTLLLLGKMFFPPGLLAIFVVGMIGVIMSSQDSLLNTGATIFTRDMFVMVFPRFSENDKVQLMVSRIATVAIAALSVVLSQLVPSVIDGLLFCYEIWAPCLLPVLIASVFLDKHSWVSSVAAISVGILVVVTWKSFSLGEYFPTILAGVALSSLAYSISHFLLVVLPKGR